MDNIGWPYVSPLSVEDEYLSFLQNSGTFINYENFANTKKIKSRAALHKTTKNPKTKASTVHALISTSSTSKTFSTGKNPNSRLNTVHAAGTHLLSNKSNSSKKRSKKRTKSASKSSKKSSRKSSRKSSKKKSKKISTQEQKINYATKFCNKGKKKTKCPHWTPPPSEIKSESYISLPKLNNPTTTTNSFTGVVTVVENNIGYSFDSLSNYGVNFNLNESGFNNIYKFWQKLDNNLNGYISNPKNLSIIIMFILEVKIELFDSRTISSVNSKTGVYTMSENNSYDIKNYLKYDPTSRFGVKFIDSPQVGVYYGFSADNKGNMTDVDISVIPPNVKTILEIKPIDITNQEQTGGIVFTPDPKLLYRVTDTGVNTTGVFTTHFPSSTEIILDSRAPVFDNKGNIISYGSTADAPVVGALVNGPFIKKGTVIINIVNIPSIPSNSKIPGQIIRLNQPLVNITEKINDVFSYTFSKIPVSIAEAESTLFLFKRNSALLYRITDIGSDTNSNFTSHFSSDTQIIFDTRKPIIDGNGNVINFGSTEDTPKIGSTIDGPFIQSGTTVVRVENITSIPSNPSVPGQIITISKPLVNKREDEGQIFVYTFTDGLIPTGSLIKLNPDLSYRVTDYGYDNTSQPVTHFLSSTKIILDSRKPILRKDGPTFNSDNFAPGPTIGQTINGPFIQPGTTVINIEIKGAIPSDLTIPAQVITISKPLINVNEKPGDIYTYIFS